MFWTFCEKCWCWVVVCIRTYHINQVENIKARHHASVTLYREAYIKTNRLKSRGISYLVVTPWPLFGVYVSIYCVRIIYLRTCVGGTSFATLLCGFVGNYISLNGILWFWWWIGLNLSILFLWRNHKLIDVSWNYTHAISDLIGTMIVCGRMGWIAFYGRWPGIGCYHNIICFVISFIIYSDQS